MVNRLAETNAAEWEAPLNATVDEARNPDPAIETA
jgi:hypothetical protein